MAQMVKRLKWTRYGMQYDETEGEFVWYHDYEKVKALLEALKELLFASQVVDGSEQPTDEDINRLLDAHSKAQIVIAKAEKGA